MLPNPRPYCSDRSDPRQETKNQLHPLTDILMIVFCAGLSGIEDWVGMQVLARDKQSWRRQFLDLPHGIPSPDPLSAVMGRLVPTGLASAFLNGTQSALPRLEGEQIGPDGKTWRGSRNRAGAVHRLSTSAAKARLGLAQQAVKGKSTELTVLPDVLELLARQGAGVTSNAIGCQKAITEKISPAGADSVWALTHNPKLPEDVA